MPEPKFVDGEINFKLKTFDGSFVSGKMSKAEANVFLSNAEVDASEPGYELVSGAYRFETEKVEVKLPRKGKAKDVFDEV